MSRGKPWDGEYVAFVTARQPHLMRIAVAICGDRHRAEDVLQTALTKLYLAWPKMHRDGREEAYVRTIIARTHVDELRRPWRRELSTDAAPERPAPEVAGPDEHPELFRALQELPEMQRKVVVLRHWLGLSVRETAHDLRISEGTVKSHSSRAVTSLRAAMERLDA